SFFIFSKSGTFIKKIKAAEEVSTLDISPKGDWILYGREKLILSDTSGNISVRVDSPHPGLTTKVRFSPAKKIFASLGVYGSVKLWDYEGRLIYEFLEMPVAWNVTFQGDNILIAGRNKVKIWTLPNLVEDFIKIE
ncbi:MAG: hypothetical protein AAB316_23800, partial [Bacteroidota bacterium]